MSTTETITPRPRDERGYIIPRKLTPDELAVVVARNKEKAAERAAKAEAKARAAMPAKLERLAATKGRRL